MNEKHYLQSSVALRKELKDYFSQQTLKYFHQKTAWRHFLVVFRQGLLLGVSTWVLIGSSLPYLWPIAIFVQGFTVFNFTVLLHEVVHRSIFAKNRPWFYKILGYCYAIPSGISASQFTRWHLDHHDQLGNGEKDPKRHYLTPKVNKRWYKALYFTPILFPIYFRAAGRETKTYPAELQSRIRKERLITIGVHLSVLFFLWSYFSFEVCLRTYILPIFFVFPIAFTVNRLGQHYNINPQDPAHWSTRMQRSWFWDFWFLWSNYHLEHHYYPTVPFYRLPELNWALISFYERHQIPEKSYASLLSGWFIANHPPHTHWDSIAVS